MVSLSGCQTNWEQIREILVFENVFDLKELSGTVMGKDAIDYLNGGADDSKTVNVNVEGYQKIQGIGVIPQMVEII
ncbi:MAG TPA: hypothetical protein VK921_08500 [Anditalea sp.]|nr:hypothetical protein [Anditalea sp.]